MSLRGPDHAAITKPPEERHPSCSCLRHRVCAWCLGLMLPRPPTPVMARIQFWLQGWPDKQRPYLLWKAGNAISSARWLVWCARRAGEERR